MTREGDLEAFDLKGDMDLRINNPAYAKVSLLLGDLPPQYKAASSTLQFQQHPNINKFSASSDQKLIALKDSGKSFPVGQGLGVLRWKFTSKDDGVLPLTRKPSSTIICDAVLIARTYFSDLLAD